MSVTIKLTVSNEFSAQVELMCSLNSTNKYKWISGLIRDEMAVFFKHHKEKEIQEELDKNIINMRKSWGLDEVTNKNLITIGASHVVPPAY
jgi:hypothetical protein